MKVLYSTEKWLTIWYYILIASHLTEAKNLKARELYEPIVYIDFGDPIG